MNSFRAKKNKESLDGSESDWFIGRARQGEVEEPSISEIEEPSITTPLSESEHKKRKKSSNMEAKLLKRLDRLTQVLEAQQLEQQALVSSMRSEVDEEKPKKEVPLISPPELSYARDVPTTNDDQVQLQKFNRDVRRAFQSSTSLLILAVLLVLGYFTCTMIDEYLPPFFWAVLLSIMLRKPKSMLLRFAQPLKAIERQQLGYFATVKAKLAVLNQRFDRNYVYGLVGMIVMGKICCYVIGWGCWVPWFTLGLSVAVLVLLVFVLMAFTKSDSFDSFTNTVLVFGFLICLVLFVVLFGFKAITETGDFAFKIQDIVEEKVKDPRWREMLIEYGITEDSIAEGMQNARVQLDEWAETQGYNITEIEEQIMTYSAMIYGEDGETALLSNGTDTVIITDDEAANQTVVESATGGLAAYIPDIGLDELRGYYDQFSEVVDVDAVKDVAGTVGSFLFGTGSGLLGVFGSIASSIAGAIDSLLQFVVFIGALFYFMESNESVVEMVVRIVPVSKDQQDYLADTIHQNIFQVFVTSFLLSVSHGFATLLYFTVFGLDFAYVSAFIVGAMALFPLTSAWLIYTPTLLIAYFHGNEYVLYIAIGLFALEQALGFVDGAIFELIPGSSPYLTGIGLAVGVSTFGVQGILIGPMLIVTTKTLFQIFCLNVSEPTEETAANKIKVE